MTRLPDRATRPGYLCYSSLILFRVVPMRCSRFFAAAIVTMVCGLETVSPVLADSHMATPTDGPGATTPEGYRAIAGEDWSFSVPPDWQTTQIAPPNVGAIAIPAQLSDSQGQILVNLATQPLQGDVTDYIAQSLEGMSNFGITIHGQRSVMAGGLEGVEVESTFPSTPPARVWQRISASNSMGYVLTCGTLETNAEAARTICVSILNTFQISVQ